MIWVKDWNEDREDPDDVDIFNIIQKVQDTGIHLEVDEEQWKITQGSKKQAKWVWSPRTVRCQLYGFQILLIMLMNDTRVLCLKQTKVTILLDKEKSERA